MSPWVPAIWLAFMMLNLGIHLARDGKEYTKKFNFGESLVWLCILSVLLWWGGFFSPLSDGFR